MAKTEKNSFSFQDDLDITIFHSINNIHSTVHIYNLCSFQVLLLFQYERMRYNQAFLSHFRFSLITYDQRDDYGWSYVVILQDMGQAKPEHSANEKKLEHLADWYIYYKARRSDDADFSLP